MKSNPITRIAGTNYGSAPITEEVTKDAKGKTPAKFERMQPVAVAKQTDPIEEDVQGAGGNLERGKVTYDFSGGTTNIIRQPSSYTWSGPLDTSGNYYEKLAKEEGFKGFKGTIKEYEQSKLKKMNEEGDPNVGEQQGEEIEEYVPGSKLAKFAYTPQSREADTFTIRQSRRQDRDVRATKRRLDRQIKRATRRGEDPTENPEVQALQAKYDRKLREQKQGVNPYLTKRSKENVKADKGTQTKAEFESKYGTTGFTGLKDFTPSKINFSNPTLPTSNNTISDFSGNFTNIGNGDYSKIMNLHNSVVSGNQGDLFNNPKAASQKKAITPFKMKGYGSKYNK